MRFVKAVAAFVGGLTPLAVAGALALFKVNVDVTVIAAWLAALSPLLATLAVAAAPANAPKPEKVEDTPLPPGWDALPVPLAYDEPVREFTLGEGSRVN